MVVVLQKSIVDWRHFPLCARESDLEKREKKQNGTSFSNWCICACENIVGADAAD